MTRFIISLAIAATVTPALAVAAPEPARNQVRFERDGGDFVTSVRTTPNAQYISGQELNTGARFDLKVANGMVTGTYGHTVVHYKVTAAARPVQTALDTSAQ